MVDVARWGPRQFGFVPASVEVLRPDGTAATLYTEDGVTVVAGPTIAADGTVTFHAPPGPYRVRARRTAGDTEPIVASFILDPRPSGPGGGVLIGADTGPQGPPGAPGAPGVPGTLATTYRGEYSGKVAYVPGDAVSYRGATYLATVAQAAPSATATAFEDLFNRTSTGPGNGWTQQAGANNVDGTKLTLVTSESGIFGSTIIRDLGTNVGTFTTQPLHPAGLWLRAAGTGATSSGIAVRTDGIVYEFTGSGAFTQLASFAYATGEAIKVVIGSNNAFTVYCNDVQRATFTSTLNSASTSHGLHVATGGAIDSYRAEPASMHYSLAIASPTWTGAFGGGQNASLRFTPAATRSVGTVTFELVTPGTGSLEIGLSAAFGNTATVPWLTADGGGLAKVTYTAFKEGLNSVTIPAVTLTAATEYALTFHGERATRLRATEGGTRTATGMTLGTIWHGDLYQGSPAANLSIPFSLAGATSPADNKFDPAKWTTIAASGSKWFVGTGTPTTTNTPNAAPGDQYLDSTTGDIYTLGAS